jgi:hypothetical protein
MKMNIPYTSSSHNPSLSVARKKEEPYSHKGTSFFRSMDLCIFYTFLARFFYIIRDYRKSNINLMLSKTFMFPFKKLTPAKAEVLVLNILYVLIFNKLLATSIHSNGNLIDTIANMWSIIGMNSNFHIISSSNTI